jgi:peptidoglycan/LPS O-acetylase OafA/YrhL
MLGITVSTHYAKISEFARTQKARIFIIFAALGFIFSSLIVLILRPEEPVGFRDGVSVFNYVGFGKLCLLAVVFLLFERHMNVRNRFLGWMAQISFGLFFLQGFFMIVFQKAIQSLPSIPPELMVVSEVIFVLGGSVVAVVTLKKILGGRSRYVIGC